MTESERKTWDVLGARPDIAAPLIAAGMTTASPVQEQALPAALEGRDLIVSAPTGTGKTLGFLLPVFHRIQGRSGTFAVVLAPSREIALQTQQAIVQFGNPIGIHSVCLIGGTRLQEDEKLLREYPNIIVATPGRLCDHLERGNVWMEYIEVLVIDEADRMFDMGFSEQLNKILDSMPAEKQTLLFSATFTPKVEALARKALRDPARVQIGKPMAAVTTVKQRFLLMKEEEKYASLRNLLKEEPGTVFVFVRSKDRAAQLWRQLRYKGFHEATQLHSDLKQSVREEALADFKSGKYRVLIATDVVGRGIHVDEVSHVLNYDMPRESSDYIHRIGRTGRAASVGIATSFVTARDVPVVRQIEKLIKKRILP